MSKPRGIWIAGNWKMNHGPKAAARFFSELGEELEVLPKETTRKATHLILFPPAISIPSALESSVGLPVSIGAQNAHWEKSGAFTGELSGPLLQETGVNWVLVGHSERRQYFGETDETCRKRTESLLQQGLKVILCVGETREQRESNQTFDVVGRQLGSVLTPTLAPYLDGRLLIAYEPVWAIGTGLTATPSQAEEVHAFVRTRLREITPAAAERTPILYGGSVTPENFRELLSCPNVDGGLVGGASLKAKSFVGLIINS